jgi:hypothetical protein
MAVRLLFNVVNDPDDTNRVELYEITMTQTLQIPDKKSVVILKFNVRKTPLIFS